MDELTPEQKKIIEDQLRVFDPDDELHAKLLKEVSWEWYAKKKGMSVEELKDHICLRMQELIEEGFTVRQASAITFKEWEQKQ